MFSGDGVWICLPAISDALRVAGSAGELMVIPVASASPRENPQVESNGVQAASRQCQINWARAGCLEALRLSRGELTPLGPS